MSIIYFILYIYILSEKNDICICEYEDKSTEDTSNYFVFDLVIW